MKLKTILLLAIFISMIGCKQQEQKKENTSKSTLEIPQPEKTSSHLTNWKNAINSYNRNALRNTYETNAVKIISADNILTSTSEIANYYGIQKDKITSVESLFSVEANKKRGITYEIVRYTLDNQTAHIQIVIWKTKDEKVIREFEFTETYTAAEVNSSEIAKRRKLWMELCNAHNAENLVKQLYSKNTMYFNHKPLIQGTEALTKEYNYMNNENYSLQLDPLKLAIVNANFAFEIGQCSGGYGGKYILVWKKEADGNWYVYIDSNI
ncbi:hypothetical protein [uncultured Kordia sp.]|uniref:hypothetical protein n=1 Tax=uncultured Kordia sp. TaxID=507699 RepID=UPI00261AD2F2|nr:hypothetical protein [uncultured Kordia sp.]